MVRNTVDALVLREPSHLLPERGTALDVETGGRLVEEEDARAVDERQREVEPSLHPAGVAAYLAVGRLGEPDALEELVGTGPPIGAREAVEGALEAEVLAPGEHGSSAAS